MKKLTLTALAFVALTLTTYAQAVDPTIQNTNGQVQNNATAVDTLPGGTIESSSTGMQDRGTGIATPAEDDLYAPAGGAPVMDSDTPAEVDDRGATKAVKAEKKASKQQMKLDRELQNERSATEEVDPSATPEEPQIEESSDVPN